METRARKNASYAPSDEIVAREIEGEIIVVPLTSGVADMEDSLYTLNETGRAVWDLLDGKRTMEAIVRELSTEYESAENTIEEDVTGLLDELLARRIIVESKG